MLLTIDVGNTNITLGPFEESTLLGTFRMTTKRDRTSDEFGVDIRQILQHRGIDYNKITDVIISSVVPEVMHSLGSAIIKYLDVTPLVVSAGIKTGIRINTENPKEIGPDRIVDAVAAFELYGSPCLVVDFGTATTYDLIGPGGVFEAGVTAPGIRTAGKSLWGETAMLPSVEIRKPKSILAKDTITSLQAGLVYGVIGQTEYIVSKMIEESGYKDVKVIATGGLGQMIYQSTDCIQIYNPQLTLDGLRLIYNRNRK